MTAAIERAIADGRVRSAWQAAATETILALIADPDGHRLFDRPIRVTIEWPEGLPHGMTSHRLVEFARAELARCRSQPDHPWQEPAL